MISFNIEGSSLKVLSGKTTLLIMPLKNIAINSLELSSAIPTVTLYNLNVGQNESLISEPLTNIVQSDGESFTIESFLAFATLNFGVDSVVDVTSTSEIGLSGTSVLSLINSQEIIGGNSGVLKVRHGVLYSFSFTNIGTKEPQIIYVSFFDESDPKAFNIPKIQIAVPYALGGNFISESFPLGIDFKTAIGYSITASPWNPKGIPFAPLDGTLAMTLTYDSIA